MEHFIWSTGEKVEKSYKSDYPIIKEKDENNDYKYIDTTCSNKRELSNTKLNDRNMISQIGQNPFMANNNYLHDLEVQQNFLIPKNSNYKEGNLGSPQTPPQQEPRFPPQQETPILDK